MRKTKYKVFHQILSIMLCVVLVLGYMPVQVLANTGITYIDEEGKTQSCDSAIEVTADTTTWSGTNDTEAWYVVSGEVTINTRIAVTGNVHLILADDASLTVHGGIGLSDENSKITIYGQENGTGKLIVADVQYDHAGIGSSIGSSCGAITINGGTITATGGMYGAGIGSGFDSSCEAITINGGTITATGGDDGVGIGSGSGILSSCGAITINGGTITATGKGFGSGIGSAYSSSCEAITINGGTITATGGEDGSGIGSGFSSFCGDITINGGMITAAGGEQGAGIGSGYSSSCGAISINGGTITAIGGEDGAGIGNGLNGSTPSFTLNGDGVLYTTSIDVNDSLILSKGILFEGTTGTVYGTVTVSKDMEVAEGENLTIPETGSLNIAENITITNHGEITNDGTIINNGTFDNRTTINNNSTFTNNSKITNTGKFVNVGTLDGTSDEITCTNHYEDSSTCTDLVKVCEICRKEYETIISQGETYSVKENRIMVSSCSSNAVSCAHENGALTLNAEDRAYTGVLYTGASVSVYNFPISENAVTIVYYDDQGNQLNGAPVKTGTYTAKVTIEDAIAEDSFVISKAERDVITVDMEDYTYGEMVGNPTLSGMVIESESIVYYYNTTNSTTGGKKYQDLTGTTLEPGTYYMYAVIGESENYLSYTTKATAFTVKSATINWMPGDVLCTYDGTSQKITVTGPAGAVIRYGTEKGKYTLTESPAYTNVGTYTIYYQITARGYYTLEGSASITIQAASVSGATVALEKKSYVCDGKSKKPAVTVTLSNKTLVNGTDYTVTYSNNKNIGTATVIITGKGNYTGTLTDTFTIKLSKGDTFTSGKYKYKVTGSSTVAFAGIKNTSTTKVTIPKTVTFGGVTFKVTSIADNALKGKTKVTSVTIGTNVTKIGKNAFYGCKGLKAISIQTEKLKSVGNKAFKGISSTATIKVPTSKYSSYKKMFDGKGLGKKVSIVINPEKGDTFTSGNNKYKVTSSSTVTFTGLKNTKKTESSIPKAVTFGGKTFKVTAIAEKALKGNTKLKKVTIGENVKTIGASAFYGCKNLKTIIIKSTKLTTVGKNALKGINAKATIKVPAKKLSDYKNRLKNKGQGKKVTIEKNK